MKFNWRANWEILLVLVIIVVGIVITTIAAIRNKDKPLPLPEEADFGQLLGLGEAAAASANGAPNSTSDESGQQHQLELGAGRRAKGGSRVPSAGGYHHPAVRELLNGSTRQLQPNSNIEQASVEANLGQDQYEPMSTEPTPSQSTYLAQPSQQNQNLLLARQRNRTTAEQAEPEATYVEQLGEQVDLIDDIHTTRSSLAAHHQRQLQQATTGFVPLPELHAAGLALQAPYGVTPSQLNQLLAHQQANNNHKLEPTPNEAELLSGYTRLAHHQHQHHHQQPLVGPHQHQQHQHHGHNLTETLLRDYALAASLAGQMNSLGNSSTSGMINSAMLANLIASQGQNQESDSHQQQLLAVANQQQQQQQQQVGPSSNAPMVHHQRRHFAAGLPISVLLGDLLKLARPQQQQQNYSTDGRPHAHSILQQLRSIPGPLLSLLQGHLSGVAHQGGHHESNSQQHDASESNQHYHRISIPIEALGSSAAALGRLSSSVLPAFPAPKGVPQAWVPPTTGGSPAYHSAQNVQADFVAPNVAGFVRSQQSLGAATVPTAPRLDNGDQMHSNLPQSTPAQIQVEFAGFGTQGVDSSGGNSLAQVDQFQQQVNQPHQQQQQQRWQQNAQKQAVNFSGQNLRNQADRFKQPVANFVNFSPIQMDQQLQQQQQQQPNFVQTNNVGYQPVPLNHQPRISFGLNAADFGAGGVESAPKVSIAAKQNSGAAANQQQQPRHRTRRSTPSDQLMSGGYMAEDKDDGDGRPISVVRPDGQPTQGGRIRGFLSSQQMGDEELELPTSDSQAAQSQRQANHLRLYKRPHLRHQEEENAGAGLMSKLLLSAGSSRDEAEEEADDDDDGGGGENSAQERRKEELEDAEFGLVDRPRQAAPETTGGNSNELSKRANSNEAAPRLGSGSTDSSAYSRRDQRSDIEFYGHPGEETRTLKYGILGSGNYEVVNGGVYADADESTAAVNSVANYARKPGAAAALLLAGKLHDGPSYHPPGSRLGGFMRDASAHADLAEHLGAGIDHKHLAGPLLELIDANGAQIFDAHMLAQLGSSGSSARSQHADSPQSGLPSLEGDPNLVQDRRQEKPARANKTASGKLAAKLSTRKRQHEQQNELLDESDREEDYLAHKRRTNSNGKLMMATASQSMNELEDPQAHHLMGDNGRTMQQQQSSIRGSTVGTNQFNSYEILPSKKVTIFSEKDLDSAPSDTHNSLPWIHRNTPRIEAY